ncbi:hypothetical protein C1X35_31130 [Pseudomonas sp. FW306-1C-G01A]|nr:hypothetical protein C1X56_31390 [Pseudomonas sp. GW101-1A09]PMV85990.1 hypothetical protein C1X51_29550 [Pseudomonas sp. FW306-2-2C-B10A]PMV90926.1 hypothetical protein C1X55_31915 [Pseudomonas sp. GW460-C8]PMV98062.1 hypothetical protein C1X50_31240 [Pseudomonas sp. MPR-TSA4]PMW08609.1 hypothetical protein C1X52_28895 [Pseudomonas sp. FW306-2-1A-C05A]PMW09907.1 hypothetical protein C1X40_32115 [Pseudomonas sp. GW456-11-11-14-TSB2]PMW11666.1 hypothetical protein C1X53_32015 [Pseudomonas s
MAIQVWRPDHRECEGCPLYCRGHCTRKAAVMAAVRGRPSGLPVFSVPVRQPAHSCHPIVWRRLSVGLEPIKQRSSNE